MTRISRIALGAAGALLLLAVWKSANAPERLVPPGPRDAEPPETCIGIAPAPPPSLWLADLTWEETCGAIAAGFRTVIVPTAGLEQNGRHAVLGKHRRVVTTASERIASEVGHVLIAPVVDYVPESRIDPPAGHMRFAGTISVPERVFEAVLESAARSLRQHGFTLVAFVGDSGDSQASQARVAARLAGEWNGGGVLHVSDYYAKNGQVDFLKARGETDATIGTHAGIRDTSELLAVDPAAIRPGAITRDPTYDADGSDGDPTRATPALGDELLRLKVSAAAAQIRTKL